MTIRRTKPTQPFVNPTTSTPFELLEIKEKIRKGTGCGSNGLDPLLEVDLDQRMCLYHKQHDYVWIKMQNYWKKTFKNKQFHLYRYCFVRQHPSFNFESVQMSILYTLNAVDLHFLRMRLDQAC